MLILFLHGKALPSTFSKVISKNIMKRWSWLIYPADARVLSENFQKNLYNPQKPWLFCGNYSVAAVLLIWVLWRQLLFWLCLRLYMEPTEKRFDTINNYDTFTLHKKWSFLLGISSVNMTKSAIKKFHFLCSVNNLKISL